MRRETRTGATRQAVVVALLLTAFSLSGLACGLVTHAVAGGLLSSLSFPTATAGRATQAPTRTATTAPATATAVATIIPPAGFSLHAYPSPSHASPGEQVKIIATVIAPDGFTPLAGVQCILQAPENGTPPLLTAWPAPQVTDSAGQAIWTLTVPSLAPGGYGVEVIAYGRNNSNYKWDPTVTVRG